MGDDFDLFPKRENLDPFSFGKKEKAAEPEKAESGDELFGQEEPSTGPLPDLPLEVPSDAPEQGFGTLPDLPLGDTVPEPAPPPLPEPDAPGAPAEAPPDPLDAMLSDGPISEEKTFDEPVFEQDEVSLEEPGKGSRKSPSPFIVVGGALIIIIVLLYGALTYLKRDKAPPPVAVLPPVSVEVPAPTPEPAPVPDTGAGEVAIPAETQGGQESPEAQGPASDAPETETVDEPGQASPATVAVEAVPASEPATVSAAQAAVPGEVQYSVQVGAFILDSSVQELEKRLRSMDYDPFLKKGSTTAMMNMLTVGPFNRVEEARTALSRLTAAGVDCNMRRRNDGGAVINAGSYLLEENAASVTKKIRSLGYPVKLRKQEARLPMTFVRVGRYPDMETATGAKDDLSGKGFDGIVVKLQ